MRIFRISFINQGQVYQLHAESVRQGELYGFVEVAGLLFGEHTTVVIDPSEEPLKSEFAGVERLQVPLHAVIRIDEVDRRGQNKILDFEGGKVTPFPTPIYTPKPGSD
jgi:hypothetical protein